MLSKMPGGGESVIVGTKRGTFDDFRPWRAGGDSGKVELEHFPPAAFLSTVLRPLGGTLSTHPHRI